MKYQIKLGGVLAPIMFTGYVNYMVGVTGYISMFVDDAKIMRKVTNQKECAALSQDLDKIN